MFNRGTFRRTAAIVAMVAVAAALATSCSSSDGDDASDGEPTTTTAGTKTSAADDGKGDSGSFSLVTYNVAGLPQEISEEHPKENIPQISPRLEPFDVVATQEDFDWWLPGGLADGLDFNQYHSRLRADVTHEFQSPKHPGYEAVGLDTTDRPVPLIGDGIGLLSRLPLADYQRVPWDDCFGGLDTSDGGAADCASMKGFGVATATLPNGAKVDIYSVHGEAGGSETDQELQAADYEQLADYIASHSKGKAVIVAGDTNLHTDTTHEDSGKGADIEIWADFLDATGLTDSCTANDCANPGDIDKIAYRSGQGVVLGSKDYADQRENFLDDAGEPLSDHDPISVTITWTSTES